LRKVSERAANATLDPAAPLCTARRLRRLPHLRIPFIPSFEIRKSRAWDGPVTMHISTEKADPLLSLGRARDAR